MRFFFVSTLCGFLCVSTAFAAELRIAAVDAPPLSFIEKNGKISGPSVEIARELVKRTGMSAIEIGIPISRLHTDTDTSVSIFTLVGRNSERESEFRWIGLLKDEPIRFATLKAMPAITSMEEAKKAKSIGVNRGGTTEKILIKEGLTNLSAASDDAGNARKLTAKVIDAWFISELLARYSLERQGFDPNQVNYSGNFGSTKFWIAASKKMPEEQFQTLKKAFEQLQKEGVVEAHVAHLTHPGK